MTMTKLSIITPAFNAEKTLSNCIESVLNQDFNDYELIIVDDGSWDSTADICRAYCQKDTRILYANKENGGVSSARNRGLDIAQGEYIVFLDADDTLLTGALELLMNDGEEDLVIGGVRHVVSDCLEGFLNVPETCKYIIAKDAEKLDSLFCQVYVTAPWSKRFRRSIIEENNLRFDSRLFYGEDTDFVLKYISRISSLRTVNSAITVYNDARIARHTKYNMSAVSYMCLAEVINRNITVLEARTSFDFPVLSRFLRGYATDIFFDSLTHEKDFVKFRSEIMKVGKRKELLYPSSRKKKLLNSILFRNAALAYLISRIYNAVNG